jgi:hypothetical protein
MKLTEFRVRTEGGRFRLVITGQISEKSIERLIAELLLANEILPNPESGSDAE